MVEGYGGRGNGISACAGYRARLRGENAGNREAGSREWNTAVRPRCCRNDRRDALSVIKLPLGTYHHPAETRDLHKARRTRPPRSRAQNHNWRSQSDRDPEWAKRARVRKRKVKRTSSVFMVSSSADIVTVLDDRDMRARVWRVQSLNVNALGEGL